ncbi:hypothetical protein HUW51_03620 [Adhaeribacter swui]|uniref:Uncharacterized protein n=1 Tax=Adhaeribacter swui TaxID=2086471 RepID=A0A7G7G3W7_9BACT|nr:hypothetical protein [Adhaeribacter swui]QNF31851.1 hypothetical protein HUW51_03620 [Adhaeribacter swui]
MRLDISQKGNKYTFYKLGIEKPIFKGRHRQFFFKGDYSEIFNSTDELVALVKIGNNIWFPGINRWSKATFIINFPESATSLEITIQNYSKGYWTFEYKNHQYAFYHHKWHQKSLFKDERQVARFDKRTVNLFKYDRAFVIANNDEDELLLLGIFLAYDMLESYDSDGPNYYGRVQEGVKKIDPDWQPWK